MTTQKLRPRPLRKINDIFSIDMETGKVMIDYYHWVPAERVAECKKGRGQESQVGAAQQALAANQTAGYEGQEAPINNALTALTPTSATTFSPAVQAQYDSDLANLHNTYGNLAQSGFRTLQARGFGSAPTGAASSLKNTMLANEGNQEANAFRNAQVNNTNQGFAALGARQNYMNSMNPNPSLSGASTTYSNLNKMGSTAGDVLAGISGLAGATGSVLTGLNT